MNVPSLITPEEMREAMRLNFDPSSLWKIALRNPRIFMMALMVPFFLFGALVRRPFDSGSFALPFALLAAVGLVLLLSYRRTSREFSRAINYAGAIFVIDTKGLTRFMPNGARTWVPWSAIRSWREGDLVFTIGPASDYNLISKRALGHMNAGELRSILRAEVTGTLGAGRQYA